MNYLINLSNIKKSCILSTETENNHAFAENVEKAESAAIFLKRPNLRCSSVVTHQPSPNCSFLCTLYLHFPPLLKYQNYFESNCLSVFIKSFKCRLIKSSYVPHLLKVVSGIRANLTTKGSNRELCPPQGKASYLSLRKVNTCKVKVHSHRNAI